MLIGVRKIKLLFYFDILKIMLFTDIHSVQLLYISIHKSVSKDFCFAILIKWSDW